MSNKSSFVNLSKVLTAVITLTISFLVIIISLGVAILNRDTWEIIKYTLEQSAVYFDSSVSSLIIVITVTIFFEFMFMILCGFLGIIIGNKYNNLKIIKLVIAGFLIYILFSVMLLGILYIAGFVNSDIMDIFNNTLVSFNTLKSTMFVGIVIYLVYNIAIYFIGNRLLNKGINVD